MTTYQDGFIQPPDTSNWPKNPHIYPFPVGDGYVGEDPSGYWIYAADNTYHPNQDTLQQYNEDNHLSEPKPKQPGIWDTVAPIAAGAGAIAGGQYIGSQVLPGLFNLGSSTVPSTTLGGAGVGAGAVPTSVAPSASAAGVNGSISGAGGAAAVPTSAAPASAAPFSGIGGGAGGSSAAPSGAFAGIQASGGVSAAPQFGSTLGSTASGLWGSGGSTVAGQGIFGLSGASPILGASGAASGALTGLEQGLGVKNFLEGNDLSLTEQAALALPTFGLSFLANPISDFLGLGHSQNYYDAKNRQLQLEHIAEALNGDGSKDLTFTKPDGSAYTVNSSDFRHNQDIFNYDQSSSNMQEDIGAANAAAYLLGFKPGDKDFTDWAGLLANAHKNGVSTGNVFAGVGLPSDHDHLYGQVILDEQAGKIDHQTADQLKNGLDQSFHVGAYAGGKKPAQAVPVPVPVPTPAPVVQAVQAPIPAALPPKDNNVQGAGPKKPNSMVFTR